MHIDGWAEQTSYPVMLPQDVSSSRERPTEEHAVLVWKAQKFESQLVIRKVTSIKFSATQLHQSVGVWMRRVLRCLAHGLLPEILSTAKVRQLAMVRHTGKV
jgi:hypothetical protein